MLPLRLRADREDVAQRRRTPFAEAAVAFAAGTRVPGSILKSLNALIGIFLVSAVLAAVLARTQAADARGRAVEWIATVVRTKVSTPSGG